MDSVLTIVFLVVVASVVEHSQGQTHIKKKVCIDESVLCHDGLHCVEKAKFCDGQIDCSDFSDELFCGKQNCTPVEFPCLDGDQCVPRAHICDYSHDCHDGSDEDICEATERCNEQHGRYLCKNAQQCINMSLLCNGKHNCQDQSDEGGQCDAYIISEESRKKCISEGYCGHSCLPTPTGSVCQCKEGFLLQGNSCQDINECQDKVCSQHCGNIPGSYNCSCDEGYNLENSRLCIANGSDPVLYIAAYNRIVSYNIRSSNKELVTVVDNLSHVQYIAADGTHLYWTDETEKAVYKYDIDYGHMWKVVDTGIESPRGITVDAVTHHLYIVDSSRNKIIVCDEYGEVCTVIQEDLHTPEDILIVYKHRILIWSEVGKNPAIMKSQLDGKVKSLLINNDIQHPSSIAVDEPTDRLYWLDSVLDRIESIQLDGSDRQIVLSRKVVNPFGLFVFEDAMYWADQDHSSVMSANKFSGRQLLPLATGINHVTSLVIDQPVLYPSGQGSLHQDNACLLSPCSDICLPSQTGHTCRCSVNKVLDVNKRTCTDNVECPRILIGENRAILIYPLCGIGKQDHLTFHIITEEMQKVSVIAQSGSKLLYRDVRRGVIAYINLNESKPREIILFKNLHTVSDVCVDWNSRILYWTDPFQGVVQAGKFNEGLITTIVRAEKQYPNSIAFDPVGRKIYYSTSGKHPQIISCYSDGDNCSVISVNVSLVSDMVVDQNSKRLFYTETGDHSIHAISLEGDVPAVTIHRGTPGENPKFLAVYMDTVYWIDSDKKVVMSVQTDGRNRLETQVLSRLAVPNEIIVVPSSSSLTNFCSKGNGECMHFCFATPNGRSCKCKDGWTLDSDQKSCNEIKCNQDTCDRIVTMTTVKVPTEAAKICGGFVCIDGNCIGKEFVCDGNPDCYDKSDELECNHENIGQGSPEESCDADYRCSSGECIPLHSVCDGILLCTDGSDEGKLCASACKDSVCRQGCYATPTGPVCYCDSGYQLTNNNVTCVDVNECDVHNGGCSQFCFNKNGSHVCSCVNGYRSSDNGRLCTANNLQPSFMIGTLRDGVIVLDDHQQKIDTDRTKNYDKITTLDVNMHTGDRYFYSSKGIHLYSLKKRILKTISKRLEYVSSIAFDWIGENLYVSDETKKHLLVCSVNSEPLQCRTVLYEEVDSVALYPDKGLMFIASIKKKQILKLCMSGTHHHVIIDRDLSMPTDIVVDMPANRIYWIDKILGRVESANLNGEDRYIVIEELSKYHFTALDVFENDIYVTDQKSGSLFKMIKFGGNKPEVVLNGINMPSCIRVIHPLLQKYDKNVCQPLHCSQLCLLTVDGAECSCFDGYLLHNKTQCIDIREKSVQNLTPQGEIIKLVRSSTKQPTTHSVLVSTVRGDNPTKIPGDDSSDVNKIVPTEIINHNGTEGQQCYLPCHNDGHCFYNKLEPKCICENGYNGKLCEIEVNSNHQSYTWVLGVVIVVLSLVMAALYIYFIKYKRDGYHYIPCRKKPDDSEEGLVTEMTYHPTIFGNGVFQDMDDINYPPDFTDSVLNLSCQSVDSAFVSKHEETDSEASQSPDSTGRYSYVQI
ncbi:vitellogenin receptor-like isoform X1 [Mytilus edulis]|uniref:vitellogenin receptor-like isoform X1 n=1 Tax=Mytilus edulis TaxID=6550 RepID=UPI0039F07D7D